MLEMKQKIRSNFSSMSINYQILIVIVKLLMILHKSDLNFCQNVFIYALIQVSGQGYLRMTSLP